MRTVLALVLMLSAADLRAAKLPTVSPQPVIVVEPADRYPAEPAGWWLRLLRRLRLEY